MVTSYCLLFLLLASLVGVTIGHSSLRQAGVDDIDQRRALFSIWDILNLGRFIIIPNLLSAFCDFNLYFATSLSQCPHPQAPLPT